MDFIQVGGFGRPSQMAISDGFKFLRLLVLSAEVLTCGGCVRVDLELVNQEVFELGVGKSIEAQFPQDYERVAQVAVGRPVLLCRTLEGITEP